jgi:hypothetical protein
MIESSVLLVAKGVYRLFFGSGDIKDPVHAQAEAVALGHPVVPVADGFVG